MREQFEALSGLAQTMKASRAIAFVGAGASKQSGYPLWIELLGNLRLQLERQEGREFVAELVKDVAGREADPRWIAEVYTEALANSVDREEAIGSALNVTDPIQPERIPEPSEIHRLLARLPFRQFITTNYDRLIETACNDERARGELPCRPFNAAKVEGFNGFLKSFSAEANRRSVLHMHGVVDERMTLALSDYDEQYLGEGMLLRMYTIFATSTVVFIGTSLTDVDLMQMIRRAHWHGDRKTRHYAFIHAKDADQAAALARSYGIRAITYGDPAAPDDHSDLNRVLSHLLELTEGLRSDGPIRPQGNRPPVIPDSSQQPWERDVEDVELRVKDRIRTPAAELPIVAVHGLSESKSDSLLRRLAVDYRRIPRRFGFSSVIWLSPKRIGLFPTSADVHEAPRTVVHSVFGEITRVIGEHRLTATLDDALNQRQLAEVLKTGNTLLVLAGADVLYRAACRVPGCTTSSETHDCGRRLLGDLLSGLPDGSVALIAAEAPPWAHDRVWQRFQETRDDDADPDVEQQRRIILEQIRNGITASDRGLHRELICALAILAGPITIEELAARLHRSPVDLIGAVEELDADNLLEIHRDEDPGTARLGPWGELDVTNPVRSAILETVHTDPVLTDSFRSTGLRLHTWAYRTLRGLQHWQHDNDQYERVNQLLPDMLTVFHAACFISAERADSGRHLRLGIELTSVLMRTGRWSEAHDFGLHLEKTAKQRRSPEVIDVEIVRSQVLSLAYESDTDLVEAQNLGRKAQRHRYATPTQQRRATMAVGVAQLGRGDSEEALRAFQRVWQQAWRECERREEDRNLLDVAEEAAGWYVESRLAKMQQEHPGKADRRALKSMLRTLDRRAALLDALRSKRELGHNWRLRGDVLHAYESNASARRCYARALVVSHEFRDRLLEAYARLGIGRCDADATEIERSVRGLRALKREAEADAAWQAARRLRRNDSRNERSTPDAVFILGPPASGKSTVLEVATEYLGRGGFDPIDVSETFRRWPKDPNDIEALLDREGRRNGNRRVLLAKVAEKDPLELIDETSERAALRGSLLIHMQPFQRSGGRTSRTPWLPNPVPATPEAEPPTGFESWDSALEYFDISYVAIDSNVQILALEREIHQALSFSYLPVERLLQENRSWQDIDR